jgi:hypothetical protein
MDITPYASEISWSDKQLSFTMVDPRNLFHPDTGAYRNYLCDGAILRLVEGDEVLSETYWVTSFTGNIHGQVGWKKARNTGNVTAKVSVFGRGETQAFKRRKITTREYSVGTDLGIALSDICETFMGLTQAEVRIPFTPGPPVQAQGEPVGPGVALGGYLLTPGGGLLSTLLRWGRQTHLRQ